ncbi:hypothetical protein [Rubrobacter indicoceani]|uniref:hypothetical protein n=1 Tax=Rubrobacter indicoceani TaxID=2051957 RepID=UPI000E5B0D82|nr:hypothetical protein [Rubrobacter indicoceani]
MRAVEQVETKMQKHGEHREPCDPGRAILTLMRMGGSRSRRAAAVIAVALLTMNQCAGIAYAEATKTILYLDAPSVSKDRASEAGEIAEEYALSAASPSTEVLAGLAIGAEQQSQLIEMADLPDETRKAFDTVLSEETDMGITADAALEAGDTMLAQLEGEEDTGEEELASSDAVRPQLGGQDPPRPEQSAEPSPPEYASVPVEATYDPVEPLQEAGDSGASLVVEQPNPEAPLSSEEDIEYASASPEPQIIEAPLDDTATDEEYGASGPITDTSPVESTLPEEPTDTTLYEPSERVEEPQDVSELPATTTQASEAPVQQSPIEEAPSSPPEIQGVAAEPAPSEEGDQPQDNGSTLQPVIDTDDTELETQNEADVAIVVPVSSPSEEMIEESENPSNSTLQSEEPSGDLADEIHTGEREVGTGLSESEEPPEDLTSNLEAGESPPSDVDDPVIPAETENENSPLVEDLPDATESLTPTSDVLDGTEPDPNAAPERNPGDEENPSPEDEDQQITSVSQEPPLIQSTGGGRNFENARPDTESRRTDRSERGANQSWDRPKPLKDPGAWTQNMPVSTRQTWIDASHQNQAVDIAPNPAVSEASLTQIVPQETNVSTVTPPNDMSQIRSGEEIVQQQATEIVQDENVRIAEADTTGLIETQALPEYVEPVQQTPSAMPEVSVEQIATLVPTSESMPTPQVDPQIQQVSEVVSDFETGVSQ